MWSRIELVQLIQTTVGPGVNVRKRYPLATLTAALATIALVTAGCGSSDSSDSTSTSASSGATATSTAAKATELDLGGPVPVKVSGPIKIAYFASCTCNTYTKSMNSAARDKAKELGVDMTVFDPAFKAETQVNQMQNALTQDYNAWAVESISQSTCNLVKKALAKGILVSIFNEQVCTSPYASGPDSYLKGTLNYVAGDETTEAFTNWVDKIHDDNPGPQNMLLVTGTPGFHQTLVTERAAKAITAKDPQFKITTINVPTYDLAGAQKAVQARLAADKNITILAGNYSDITQGAVLALKQADRTGVKVYDMGGSKWAIDSVKDGTLQMTSVFLPATESELSIESLVKAWNGEGTGPHYVNILDSIGGDPFITKANADSFKPEY